MTNCRMCQERGKTWEGGDPKCAFPEGVFALDNWNCATANALRLLMGEVHTGDESDSAVPEGDRFFVRRDDNCYGMLYLPEANRPYDEDEISNYSVMMLGCWYKLHGRLDSLKDLGRSSVTLRQAERAIQHYGHRAGGKA